MVLGMAAQPPEITEREKNEIHLISGRALSDDMS